MELYEKTLFVPYQNVTYVEKNKPYFMVEMHRLGGYINCQQSETEENICKIAGFSWQAFSQIYLEQRGFLNINSIDYLWQKVLFIKNLIFKMKISSKSENKKKGIYFFEEFSDVVKKKG